MSGTPSDDGAAVPCISLFDGTHLCTTCSKEFASCSAMGIVFGIDRDPSARGADADKVLECESYTPNISTCGNSHNKDTDG